MRWRGGARGYLGSGTERSLCDAVFVITDVVTRKLIKMEINMEY